MKANALYSRVQIRIAGAIALCVLALLGGCAGGGSGGPGPVNYNAYTYPASLADATSTDSVGGFMSPYALSPDASDPTQNDLVSVNTTVFGTSAGAGKLEISVSDMTDKTTAAVIEHSFTVTFDSSSGSLLAGVTSPLGGSLGCSDCLNAVDNVPATYVGSTTAGDAGNVRFIYLNPSSTDFPLKYSTLGIWSKPNTTSTTSSTWPEVGGAFSAGVLTRGIDLPRTGSAAYQGYMIGRFVTPNDVLADPSYNAGYPAGSYLVGADANATANFASGQVAFWTSNTQIAPESGGGLAISEKRLDLVAPTMVITGTTSATSNVVSGTVQTSDAKGFFPATSGGQQISAGFYGPPDTANAPYAPTELGGSLSVGNSSGQGMVGSFALKKTSSTP